MIVMDEKAGVEIKRTEGVAVVAFMSASVTDVEVIAAAGEQIKKFIEENNPNKVIFDFKRVKFFSSQVLGLLLDIRAKLGTCNGEVIISAIDPLLHRVFRITNLDKVFKFFPDEKSAISAVGSNCPPR